MTQFCIVSGGDPALRQETLDAIIAAFGRLGAEAHTASNVTPNAHAAVFGGSLGDDGIYLVGTPLDGRGAANRTALSTAFASNGAARALGNLDGYFAIAHVPASGAPITVSTDRTGCGAVHYASHRGLDVISTSALALAIALRAQLDPLSVREFLGNGSVYDDRTMFAGVRRIMAGTLMTFGEGTPQMHPWADPTHAVTAPSGQRGDVRSLADALVDALKTASSAHPRLVIDLTGGYDSRAILAAALRAGATFSTVVNGGDGDLDVIAANNIARVFGLNHRQLKPQIDFGNPSPEKLRRALALTDGEADALEYASVMEVQERLSTSGDATVNGSSGELCRGYWWDLLRLSPPSGRGAFDARTVAAGRFAFDGFGEAILSEPGAGTLVEHFAGVVERADGPFRGLSDGARLDNIYLAMRMQRWHGRMASATGRIWPCVAPFMFKGTVSAALSAPPEMRRGNRMAPRLIEHLNPKLAALPLAQGYPASPLRLSNAWRFTPRAVELGRKVVGRVKRQVFRIGAATGAGIGALAKVSAMEGGQAWFDASTWKTREMYKDLPRFLAASQAPGFSGARHFGRLLTLEMLARTLEA